MNSTKLSAFCDKVLEIGWLLSLIITPLFFNVYSSRVFEPDKLTTLRSVALIMAEIKSSILVFPICATSRLRSLTVSTLNLTSW